MQRHRFYAPPTDIADSTITLTAGETHHLANVLRLKPGDEVFVFDGRGREYRCLLRHVRSGSAELEILAALTNRVESNVQLTLAQAITKGEKFDLIVQKTTELGVSCIVPLFADRTEVKLSGEQATKKIERWQRISLEAIKQCGRRNLVEITAPLKVAELLDPAISSEKLGHACGHLGTLFVFAERGGKPLSDLLDDSVTGNEVTAVIGPEGGWSDQEQGLFEQFDCRLVSLGPRILRTETAAIAAVALLQHLLGDLAASL